MATDVDAQRRLLRSLIKRVHPDLFSAHEQARAQNAESLKVGNPVKIPHFLPGYARRCYSTLAIALYTADSTRSSAS